MQQKTYSEDKSISQSKIKHWKSLSPKAWFRKYIENIIDENEKENQNFILGDLLDCLLTTPDLLESRYFVSNEMEKLPSDVECKIIECTYNKIIEYNKSLEDLKDELPGDSEFLKVDLAENWDILLSCCNTEKWQSGWKDETRVAKIIERGTNYFNILAEAADRKIISSTLNMQAVELVDILKKNKWTKNYLVESDGNELLFQLEIFAEYEYDFKVDHSKEQYTETHKIPIKGAIDILRINHKDRSYQIVDVKKAFSAHQFLENVRKFGYCDQLSFYQYLVSLWILEDANKYLQEYTQLPPINIVIDIADHEPYIYSYTERDLHQARYGNKTFLERILGKYHPFRIKKGWQELLNDICWHFVTKKWDAPKSMLEEGVIQLDLLNN